MIFVKCSYFACLGAPTRRSSRSSRDVHWHGVLVISITFPRTLQFIPRMKTCYPQLTIWLERRYFLSFIVNSVWKREFNGISGNIIAAHDAALMTRHVYVISLVLTSKFQKIMQPSLTLNTFFHPLFYKSNEWIIHYSSNPHDACITRHITGISWVYSIPRFNATLCLPECPKVALNRGLTVSKTL